MRRASFVLHLESETSLLLEVHPVLYHWKVSAIYYLWGICAPSLLFDTYKKLDKFEGAKFNCCVFAMMLSNIVMNLKDFNASR